MVTNVIMMPIIPTRSIIVTTAGVAVGPTSFEDDDVVVTVGNDNGADSDDDDDLRLMETITRRRRRGRWPITDGIR